MFFPLMQNRLEIDFPDFDQVDVQESLRCKKDILDSVLNDEQLVFKDDKDGVYSHRFYLRRQGIYALRIANNRKVKVESDFNVVEIDNHPSCLVLIDNRKDRQVVAVERNAAFGKKADVVVSVIRTTLCRRLAAWRLGVNVEGKYRTAVFWREVEDAMKFKGGVEYVKFPFPYPNLPDITDLVGDYFRDWALRTNSAPLLQLIGQNGGVHLSQEDMYIVNALAACAASGRPVVIKPKGGAERKIGTECPVIEEISDALLVDLGKPDLFDSKMQVAVDFLNKVKLVYE